MPNTITIRHQIGFHADTPKAEMNKRPSSIGTIQAGTIVPVAQEFEGYEFEKELTFSDADGIQKKIKVKSNKWYQDKNGWWYWNGATLTLEEAESDSDTGDVTPPGPSIPPVVSPEKTFEWKPIMKKGGAVPNKWFKHSGKGLNIAILDAGFNLASPCFKHLKDKVKTYDLRKSTYNNQTNIKSKNFVQNLEGKDKLPSNAHGTACFGIMAANHPQKEIVGLIPDANYHLFNVYEHTLTPFRTTIINRSEALIQKAMWLISNLDIDIVSVSVNYPNHAIFPQDLISRVTRSKTLWFWALNTMASPALDKYVLNPPFPNPFIPVKTIGTLNESQLESPNNLIVTETEQKQIDFIIQKNTISIVKNSTLINHETPMECSYATPVMAGLAALKMNEAKKNKPNFIVNPKTFLPQLKKESTRFYKDFIPQDDAFTFLRLTENPLV